MIQFPKCMQNARQLKEIRAFVSLPSFETVNYCILYTHTHSRRVFNSSSHFKLVYNANYQCKYGNDEALLKLGAFIECPQYYLSARLLL